MSDDDVDVLVVGAGVAGLSVAAGLAATRRVMIVDKGDGSTRWAQGGIAGAVAADDDPRDHAADTAAAGAGLCADRPLAVLVEEGPLRLAELIAAGARFDREAGGALATTLEGGHHRRRVVHAGGDATGAEVARVLTAATRGLTRMGDATVVELTRGPGRCGPQVTGALVRQGDRLVRITARAVVLATGGIGHAYPASTNPAAVTGDGLALALQAGATLTDIEFVQFHPTVLHTGGRLGQLPLVSEALRGEGAVLRDAAGVAFMAGRHPLADLAARDVVAREIHAVLQRDGVDHVHLDATALGSELLRHRFPTVLAACAAVGVDATREPIPVAPAQHFLCGGVATDRWGATDVPGLYAVGEVAATGVHGANRLASNSLLEGLVFGRRVAARLTLELPGAARGTLPAAPIARVVPRSADVAREVLGRYAGVRRSGAGLAAGLTELAALERADGLPAPTEWTVAGAVLAAAAARTESRGCHYRDDHPLRSEWWRRSVHVHRAETGLPAVVVDDVASAA